jgi:hypothetical protein
MCYGESAIATSLPPRTRSRAPLALTCGSHPSLPFGQRIDRGISSTWSYTTRRSARLDDPSRTTAQSGSLRLSASSSRACASLQDRDWRTPMCTSLQAGYSECGWKPGGRGGIVESARSRSGGGQEIGASRERLASSTCSPCSEKTSPVLDTVGPLMEGTFLCSGAGCGALSVRGQGGDNSAFAGAFARRSVEPHVRTLDA